MAIERPPFSVIPGIQEELDIEIEQPEMMDPQNTEVYLAEDGSATIGFDPEEEIDLPFGENIAEALDERQLQEIASELVENYEEDLNSRDDWYTTFSKGLDLLGIRGEERSEPFEGASGVHHPILSEAVTQFQSQAYKELLPAGGPVDVEVLGVTNDAKLEKANRVKNFMNYQITYKMEEFDPEMDQLLFYLPLSGSAFKKIYYDPSLGRATSRFIKAEDLVVPYYAVDLLTAPRITHVMYMTENEMRKLQISGFYRETSMSDPASISTTELDDKFDELEGLSRTAQSEEFTLLEVHVDLDIEGFEDRNANGEETGLALPYIVTICKDNNEVLAIRPNYDPNDPMRKKIEHFTHFKFLPGLGFYGFGLIHMMGGDLVLCSCYN